MTDVDLFDRLWAALLPMQRLAWEQGVVTQAALDGGRPEVALAIARDAIQHQDERGRLAATGDAGLVNGGSLGEAVAALAARGEARAAEALERQRWWLLRFSPRDDEGVVWHLEGVPEVWVDSIYMVVPMLVFTGDVAPADMQYRMHREHLWDGRSGLYGHRANTVTGDRVRGAFWATGNGWAAAGMARALRIGGDRVPGEMRGRWRSNTCDLLEAVAAHETSEGRFHHVLDDPTTFTDGTAGLMFAYAAFTGVADGWLPEVYAAHARRWLDAALARVDADGVVRGVCGAPHFDSEGTSAEAQAFAIIALAASGAG
ncbi:MAG: glycoside hydrolase family 88 protein [Demequina sp.]|uniref:glycoside hydrolase family 88 protein n=1 Tax=Demequina sp. TaxID=2050685 RepID=UPI00198B6532|nr:glycoside hydrolase family 88 protein [Demequina sp.]MBC7298545.1 glycoside hydrolase family 88 protein [Demequina sp.]